jgi:hypothetical protein
VDSAIARSIAHYSHAGQLTRSREPVMEHVERVAARVPTDARTIAYLHDVLERTSTSMSELRAKGMTDLECSAIELLTRSDGEPYEAFILRIAFDRGVAGELARIVKLADLDDHLGHKWEPHDPPYAWARRHIANACAASLTQSVPDAA